MTTITPRDALEVVRKASWANEEDAHCGCEHCEKKREAIATITNLVERAGEPVACYWTYDDDDRAPMWNTGCGESWSFTEGGPADNNYRFCHGCGKPVNIIETTAPGASHER